MQQQVVLGQEAGEKQAVPLLVRALGHEKRLRRFVATQLPPLGTETVAQRGLVGIKMVGAAVGEHPQALDGGARGALRLPACIQHRRLELRPQWGGKGTHDGPQMITVLSASRCGCTRVRSSST